MTITKAEELDGLKVIGRIVANTMHAMARALEPGMTTRELDEIGRALLEAEGAEPAPEAVYDFPGATCISVNEEIAHGIPGDRVIAAGLITACLTNNVVSDDRSGPAHPLVTEVMAKFDHVIESSKVGVRKPETRFYDIACELAGVRPEQCVFLDDLGINLKPARAMGMRTIKVVSADEAIDDLAAALNLDLR